MQFGASRLREVIIGGFGSTVLCGGEVVLRVASSFAHLAFSVGLPSDWAAELEQSIIDHDRALVAAREWEPVVYDPAA